MIDGVWDAEALPPVTGELIMIYNADRGTIINDSLC